VVLDPTYQIPAVLVPVASEVVSEVASEARLPYKIMMTCCREYQIHRNCQVRPLWTTEIELTGGECQSQKGVKTSKVCQRSTIGKKVGKRIICSVCLNFSIRYSSILENYSDNNPSSAPAGSASGSGMSYLATTSSSSRVNPQYKTYRSNSQNRILSPTFSNSYHDSPISAYATMSRRPDRLKRHSSLGHEPLSSLSSSSSDFQSPASPALRLDNFVTLRRRSDYTRDLNPGPSASAASLYNNSASSSPMVLSPSNTRQFNNFSSNYARDLNSGPSREGSVTPRFSHSCSNTSLVSESAD